MTIFIANYSLGYAFTMYLIFVENMFNLRDLIIEGFSDTTVDDSTRYTAIFVFPFILFALWWVLLTVMILDTLTSEH